MLLVGAYGVVVIMVIINLQTELQQHLLFGQFQPSSHKIMELQHLHLEQKLDGFQNKCGLLIKLEILLLLLQPTNLDNGAIVQSDASRWT